MRKTGDSFTKLVFAQYKLISIRMLKQKATIYWRTVFEKIFAQLSSRYLIWASVNVYVFVKVVWPPPMKLKSLKKPNVECVN